MNEKLKNLLIIVIVFLFLWDYHSKSQEIDSLKETIYIQNEAINSQNLLLGLYEQKLSSPRIPTGQFKFNKNPI